MPLQVNAVQRSLTPVAVSGAVPSPHGRACRPCGDAIVSAPRAHPSVPVSPPPRHPVDGTPEVIAAGVALGALAFATEGAALGTAAAVRSGSSYVGRLAQSIVRCVADPVKTGEHIAEGIVGGAAWAAAAAGVTALAEAAHARSIAQPQHGLR